MNKIMKRIIAVVLAMMLVFGAVPAAGFSGISNCFSMQASAATYSGTCGAYGDSVTWNLDTSTGQLTISGCW